MFFCSERANLRSRCCLLFPVAKMFQIEEQRNVPTMDHFLQTFGFPSKSRINSNLTEALSSSRNRRVPDPRSAEPRAAVRIEDAVIRGSEGARSLRASERYGDSFDAEVLSEILITARRTREDENDRKKNKAPRHQRRRRPHCGRSSY